MSGFQMFPDFEYGIWIVTVYEFKTNKRSLKQVETARARKNLYFLRVRCKAKLALLGLNLINTKI